MNKKILLLITIAILLFLCSCSKKALNLPDETTNSALGNLQQNHEADLPPDFTIDKIKSALLEYINYRLWLYPAKIMDDVSYNYFDYYIGKSIDVEIRVYDNNSGKSLYQGKSVYAHTNIGQWLAVFKSKNEFVYCDGQASEGEYGWPDHIDSYKLIEKYSVIIQQPHKPNYGTSQRKEKMIEVFESAIKAACEEFYKGGDKYYSEWKNVDVYIANFYEWENGAHAWLCKQDGSITDFPVVFEESNDGLKVQSIKGYTIKNKDEFNEFGRFQFERDINDAVKHFKCNIN